MWNRQGKAYVEFFIRFRWRYLIIPAGECAESGDDADLKADHHAGERRGCMDCADDPAVVYTEDEKGRLHGFGGASRNLSLIHI